MWLTLLLLACQSPEDPPAALPEAELAAPPVASWSLHGYEPVLYLSAGAPGSTTWLWVTDGPPGAALHAAIARDLAPPGGCKVGLHEACSKLAGPALHGLTTLDEYGFGWVAIEVPDKVPDGATALLQASLSFGHAAEQTGVVTFTLGTPVKGYCASDLDNDGQCDEVDPCPEDAWDACIQPSEGPTIPPGFWDGFFDPYYDPTGVPWGDVVSTAYMEACAARGVPSPPYWDAGQDLVWHRMGEIGRPFAGSGRTELFLWRSETGVCVSLPRYDTSGDVFLFGQICQNTDPTSPDQGATCFWDNKRGSAIIPVGRGYVPQRGDGGDVLRENCTMCHRGDNAWVVTPRVPYDGEGSEGTDAPIATPALTRSPTHDLVDPGTYSAYAPLFPEYGIPSPAPIPLSPTWTPIGQPGWSNGLPGLTSGVGCTNGCHSIPQLTRSWCATVFEQTMMDRPELGGPLMPPPVAMPDGVDWQLTPATQLIVLRLLCAVPMP